jgi:hypothetical protein
MTLYAGDRALDAEILLDLAEGKNLTIDYTLNRYQSGMNSNRAVIENHEWKNTSKKEKFKHSMVAAGTGCLIVPLLFLMPLITALVNMGVLNNKNIHYKYQNLLKRITTATGGIWEESCCGEAHQKTITFTIPSNMWFEYELEGDYQTKIKKISLKRNIIKFRMFGKFLQRKQKGWNVIFEFIELPTNGSCTIRYVS